MNAESCNYIIYQWLSYYLQAGLSVTKPGNVSENQDQPSPISVLEPPFEDDNATLESSGNMKQSHIWESFRIFDFMHQYLTTFFSSYKQEDYCRLGLT